MELSTLTSPGSWPPESSPFFGLCLDCVSTLPSLMFNFCQYAQTMKINQPKNLRPKFLKMKFYGKFSQVEKVHMFCQCLLLAFAT